ncbi:glutamate-5-semialdehyde dehydrogenase [Bacteroidota bacterium]
MENTYLFENAREASRKIVGLEEVTVNKVLYHLADLAVSSTDLLLVENKKDLDRMDPQDPKYDRLKLTEERIEDIAGDLRNVAKLRSPIGEILEEKTLENGLHLKKIRVPLGVIGIIYESRPNVTFDVSSLCLKSGNVTVLKGSRDAEFSNLAIISLIHKVLKENDIPVEVVQLLPADREATVDLLNAVDFVDILIPRGSQQLIDHVRQNASVPVIETGAGIVHTYFDINGDADKGKAIITNAKLRRVSVCNALDCLIIHEDRLKDLPDLVSGLAEGQCEIFADPQSYDIIKETYPGELLFKATPESFGTEFLSRKMSIKTVGSIETALDHIAKHSSKHSEAIISDNSETINTFYKHVDAAAVYSNTSTAYTDGAQFEMGAEIGISTQKLHARGPMSLKELTSYKWLIEGDGQIRVP